MNPFLDDFSSPLTPWKGIVLLMLSPLIIVRLSLGFTVVALYTCFLMIMQKNVDPSDPYRPKFRNYPTILRVTKGINRAILWLFGFSLEIRGFENAEAAYANAVCPIIVANHVSYLDIFLVAAVFGPYFPVARGDMANWPVFGQLIGLWGFAGVKGFSSEASGASADGQAQAQPQVPAPSRGEGLIARLAPRVKAAGPWSLHPPVLIFPEGTCTTGRALLRFKTGAFVLGSPVLPVAFQYESTQNCGWVWARPVQSSIWRRVPRTLVQLFRIVATPRKRIVVTVLPVYVPSAEEAASPAAFATNVRGALATAMQLPDCDLAVEDARRFYAACEEGTKAAAAAARASAPAGAAERKKAL